MKLGWGVLTKTEALWVQVLRHKYSFDSDSIPPVLKKTTASDVWRGICDIWSPLRNGIRWSLGDGNSVSF